MTNLRKNPVEQKAKGEQVLSVLIDYRNMPAYKGAEDKQNLLVRNYPFISITDSVTLKKAKESRTALRQGRYELQQGEKTIVTKLKDFRDLIKEETIKLINVTSEAEQKQQNEITRYEDFKQQEKEEELKKERERKAGLRDQVVEFRTLKSKAIETATLITVKAIILDIKNSHLNVEEFETDFMNIKEQLIKDANKKHLQLTEDDRLKKEKQKAKNERLKLNKRAEDLRKKEKEIEELKKQIRDQAKKDSEILEKEKANLVRQKKEKELNAKYTKIKALGFTETSEDFVFGSVQISKLLINPVNEDKFNSELIISLTESVAKEKKYIESVKPDKVKLIEALNKLEPSNMFDIQLNTKAANSLLDNFVLELYAAKEDFLNEIVKL